MHNCRYTTIIHLLTQHLILILEVIWNLKSSPKTYTLYHNLILFCSEDKHIIFINNKKTTKQNKQNTDNVAGSSFLRKNSDTLRLKGNRERQIGRHSSLD